MSRKHREHYPADIYKDYPAELYYPSFGTEPLSEDLKLIDIGMLDEDIVFYSQYIYQFVCHRLAPVYDASEIFKEIILPFEGIHQPLETLLGVLLYTDEDVKLAKYIRENFISLDRLTGDWCTIYILEKPPTDWKDARRYWRAILNSELYEMWSLIKWITTKPFDKSESYQIARKLGVNLDQLPCLVLLGNDSERLVLPIQVVSTEYFRNMFGLLEQILVAARNGDENEASSQSMLAVLRDNFDEIAEHLETVATRSESSNSVKYILDGGNIVFINHPRGDVSLSNFQNTNPKS